MRAPLESISRETIERYSKRLRSLGDDVRTLGWGSAAQQHARFGQALKAVDVQGRSLLDIGCGFGDLKGFCDEQRRPPAHYIGWDVNSALIEVAKKRHPAGEFLVCDIINARQAFPAAQIGVMLGLLNYNLRDSYDNLEYSKLMLRRAFDTVSEVLVVDFLSSHRAATYPSEEFVFYHDPAEVLAVALELTPNVTLIHDYPPIPQKEFMLVLRK